MLLDRCGLFQCRTQGEIFEYALYAPIDPKRFVELYMLSDFAEEFDLPYSNIQGMGSAYDFEEFCYRERIEYRAPEDNAPLHNVNKDLLYWIGYLYRYWHIYTGESSREIYAIADFDRMATCYGLHSLDCSVAVDRLRER